MKKSLVVYFTCSKETEKVAKKIAEVVDGELHEIIPEAAYTEEDLNWQDKNSRSSVEMADESSRPAIKNKIDNITDYDTIYLGFPIWWYVAPRIINTFLESYNFANTKIILFCTSGGSSLDNAYSSLKKEYHYNFLKGDRFSPSISKEELQNKLNNIQ